MNKSFFIRLFSYFVLGYFVLRFIGWLEADPSATSWSYIITRSATVAFLFSAVVSLEQWLMKKDEERETLGRLDYLNASRKPLAGFVPLARHCGFEMTRQDRLDHLLQYYLHYLVEDGQDGTTMDCEIIRLLKKLKMKYHEPVAASPEQVRASVTLTYSDLPAPHGSEPSLPCE